MSSLESQLLRESEKLIKRFERYARELRDDDVRRERRTGIKHRAQIWRPLYWSVDHAFDPYHVRSHRKPISRAISAALSRHDYSPLNPVAYEVPKGDGTKRRVSVFSVADAMVSTRVYRSLLEKNKSLLSSYSYAYRDDLTVHDATMHIQADLSVNGRVFLAEYDFSKYFDSISHDYLWRVLDERNFLISPLERQILRAFLATELQETGSYTGRSLSTGHDRGLPQGTSVSLFLANVAAWELDRSLERLGVGFARYADDTLIWSSDYARISAAVSALGEISADIGARINLRKSDGISLYNPDGGPSEIISKSIVEFVGYRFSATGVGIRRSAVDRAKARLAYIVWSNLLEPLRKGQVVPNRVAPNIDRDYLVMIFQLRRYLYGDLTEAKLARLTNGKSRKVNYQGLMSFYPLVDDLGQLKALDGWLEHTVVTSLRERTRLLTAAGVSSLPVPHGLAKSQLRRAQGMTSGGARLDLSLPSFVRMGTVIRRAAAFHGPNIVAGAGSSRRYQYVN